VKKATIVLALLLLLAGVSFSKFSVNPSQDSFEVLQNSTVVRTYMLENNDSVGSVEIGTNAPWAEAMASTLNITKNKAFPVRVTFSPGMMAPGNYNASISFNANDQMKTIRVQAKVIKTNWVLSYLLPGESYTDVAYSNVTVSGTDYSLVSFGGTETFLLKNGKDLVKNIDEIKAFYNVYFRENVFPSDSELAKLSSYVVEFNTSRNRLAQYSAGYGAEDACLRFTGIYHYELSTGENVLDLTSATLACQMAHVEMMEACGDATILQGTKNMGVDTFNMDNNLSAYTRAMGEMNLENAAEKFAEAKTYIEKTRASALSANSSKLRFEMSCRDCVGACPIIPYNITALDLAIPYISTLRTKALPLAGLSTKADTLIASTNKRISDAIGKEHKKDYEKRFAVIEPLSANLEDQAAVATENVYSPELSAKLNEMKNASSSLSHIISSGDYADISRLDAAFDGYVDKFYASKAELEVLLSSANGLYEQVESLRNNASNYIIRARMNVQEGDEAKQKLDEIELLMEQTDSEFTKPLLMESATSLSGNYTLIMEQAKAIAESRPSTSILGRVVSKIIRTEKWIAYSLIETAKPLSLSEKTAIAEYVGPLVSIIVIVGMSIVLVMFVFVYTIRNRKRLERVRSELSMLTLFGVATIAVALICAGALYYLTTVYASERTLNTFIFEIDKSGGVAIVIDGASASSSPSQAETLQAMDICSQLIANSLSGYNPTIYNVNEEGCTVGSESRPYADCDKEFSLVPVVYLRYGASNLISFRTLYAANATVEGDDAWLSACHLAGAFKGYK
jgi:hypothetical protein